MAELIAPGYATSAWADVVVTAGAAKAVYIKLPAGQSGQVPSGVTYEVAHKTSGGDYVVFDTLNYGNISQKGSIAAPGTFGLRRVGASVQSGMDVEG